MKKVKLITLTVIIYLFSMPAYAVNTTITWTPPTTRTNGTALTNLVGYRLYWGTSSRLYTSPQKGKHKTGFSNSAFYVDAAGRNLSSLGVKVGQIIDNTTDGSTGAITAIGNQAATNDKLTVTLAGGTDNDFDTDDVISISTGYLDVGNVTTKTLDLPQGIWYIAATAYDTENLVSAYSNEISRNLYLTPINIVATPISSTQVNLAWNGTPQAIGFKVYKSTDGINYGSAYSTPTTNSESVTDLTANTLYYFKISSIDADGIESPLSTPISGKTLSFVILQAAVPTTTNGSLGANEWTGANYVTLNGSNINILYNNTHLLLSGTIIDDELNAPNVGHDGAVYNNDNICIMLDRLDNDGGSGTLTLRYMLDDDYKWCLDAFGSEYDERGVTATPSSLTLAWNGAWTSAVVLNGDLGGGDSDDVSWTFEIAIPWSELTGYTTVPGYNTLIGLGLRLTDKRNAGTNKYFWLNKDTLGQPADGTANASNFYNNVMLSGNTANNLTSPAIIEIKEPDGVGDNVEIGTSKDLIYTLRDEDTDSPAVNIDLYYNTVNSMTGATAITGCQDQIEGEDLSCPWDTTGMAAGDYYVCGEAFDGTTTVTSCSPGTITMTDPEVPEADLSFTKLSPFNFVPQGLPFKIKYSLFDDVNTSTLSFYCDSDNKDYDGTILGSCVDLPEGNQLTCLIDTTGLSGPCYLYGKTSGGAVVRKFYFPEKLEVVGCTIGAGDGCAGTLSIENATPVIEIIQPDGVNDSIEIGTPFNIVRSLSDDDPDNMATVSFYSSKIIEVCEGEGDGYICYDTYGDHVAIEDCAGLPEGENVPCEWDTTGMEAGEYYIHAEATDGEKNSTARSPGTIILTAP